MRNLKRLLVGLIVLAVIAVVVVFMLENQQLTSLMFFGISLPQLPVAVFIMLAFLGGLVVGPVLGLALSIKRSRRRNYRVEARA